MEPRFDNVKKNVVERIDPFFRELLDGYGENIHSLYLIGSALTEDFDPKRSDINSIVMLRNMDLGFLEHLAPRGKVYSKKGVASPLIMTPEYVNASLDSFPVEFLNFSLIHACVLGEDVFEALKVEHSYLRNQCERELKVKLIGLRQGYLSRMGNPELLAEAFRGSISDFMPLFRAIIKLMGQEPPISSKEVLIALGKASGVDCSVFERVYMERNAGVSKDQKSLDRMFEQYYETTSALSGVVENAQS